MKLDTLIKIKVIEKIVEDILIDINLQRPTAKKIYGGYLTMIETSRKEILIISLGRVPIFVNYNYSNASSEQASRLESNPSHVSARDSNDLNKQMGSGAIRGLDNWIYSFFCGYENDDINEAIAMLICFLIEDGDKENTPKYIKNNFNNYFKEVSKQNPTFKKLIKKFKINASNA